MLAVARRLRLRRIVHAARFDVGTALEALQARDFVALLRRYALQIGDLAEQPDHQSLELGRRQAVNFNRGNHSQVESEPAASGESKNHRPPGILPRLPRMRLSRFNSFDFSSS